MKLKVGQSYFTRDGQKAEVQGAYWSPTHRRWDLQGRINGTYHSWNEGGESLTGLKDYDLVEPLEFIPAPGMMPGMKTVRMFYPLNKSTVLTVQCERPDLLASYLDDNVIMEVLE